MKVKERPDLIETELDTFRDNLLELRNRVNVLQTQMEKVLKKLHESEHRNLVVEDHVLMKVIARIVNQLVDRIEELARERG